MTTARIAILLLVPAAFSMAGCQNGGPKLGVWPFRGDAAAADFAASSRAPSADPFQYEQTRLRKESLLAQQQQQLNQNASPQANQRDPQQFAGLNANGSQPFPAPVIQAAHEEVAAAPPENPFAKQARWQSRNTRTAAKVD